MPALYPLQAPVTYAVFNTKGDTIVPFGRYTDIGVFQNGLAAVSKCGEDNLGGCTQKKWGYINTKGEVIVPLVYDEAEAFGRGYANAAINTRYDMIDTTGKIFQGIPNKYITVHPEGPDFIVITNQAGKRGVIRHDGSVLIPTIYDHDFTKLGKLFVTSKIAVDDNGSENTKYGLADSVGNEILPIKYGSIEQANEQNFIWVCNEYNINCQLYNSNGQLVSPDIIDKIETSNFVAGLAKVFKNGGWKYINEQCQTIIDASSYQYVTNFQKIGNQYLAQVTKNDITSTINTKGEVVFSAPNDKLVGACDSIFAISDNGNLTLVDLTIIPPKLTKLPPDQNIPPFICADSWIRFTKDNRWGVMDRYQRIIVAPQYEQINCIENNLAMVIKEAKYAFVNRKGKQICPLKYNLAEGFDTYGLARVNIGYTIAPQRQYEGRDGGSRRDIKQFPNGQWGLIDTMGNEIVPPQYDYIGSFHAGVAVVKKDGKAGLIDTKGKVIVPLKYPNIADFADNYGLGTVQDVPRYGLIPYTYVGGVPDYMWIVLPDYYNDTTVVTANPNLSLSKNAEGKWGYIHYLNPTFIPTRYYDEFYGFETDWAPVKLHNKWGFVDKNGTEKIAPTLTYDMVQAFKGDDNKWAIVQKGNYWGYIDRNGKEVIPATLNYTLVYPFVGGMARVSDNIGTIGFINTKGNLVIPMQYNFAKDFKNGVASVEKDGKHFLINTEGKEQLVPYPFDAPYINSLRDKVLVSQDNKYGIADANDYHLICPIQYDAISGFCNKYALVQQDQLWGLLDIETCKIVIEPQYTDISIDENDHQLSWVKDNKRYYLDSTLLQTAVFTNLPKQPFNKLSNRLALITNQDTNERYVLNSNGNVQFKVTNPEYDWIQPYQDDVSRIRLADQSFCIIDTLGNEIIPPRTFKGFISNFSEGLAMVAENHRFGFINKKAQVVIPLQYESAFPFVECNGCYFYKGKARVMKNKRWIYIDKNGNCIENCE